LNCDGHIDKEEFMYKARDILLDHGVEKSVRKRIYEASATVYDESDMNGDGVLSAIELEFSGYLSGVEKARVQAGGSVVEYDFGATRVREVHRAQDLDGDGKLDINEFTEGWMRDLTAFGWSKLYMQQRVQEVFQESDIDGDEAIDWKELRFAAFLLSKFVSDSARSAFFAEYDLNQDGMVSKDEVDRVVELTLESGGGRLQVAKAIADFFPRVDRDGDGQLNQKEAAELYRLFTRG